MITLIARFMGPTWGPPGSPWPHVGPMQAPWTLWSGKWLMISLLNSREWLHTALRGPSVWRSLPGRFTADDTLFGLIGNFLTPESLTFFNNSSPGDFWSYLWPFRGHHRHVAELGNLSYIHVHMNERVGRKLNRRIILQQVDDHPQK